MSRSASVDRVLAEVERARDELVDFAAELIRIPTVNPPGENYRECAETIGARLGAWGMEVEYVEAEGRAEHTSAHPRVNVIGRLAGAGARPCLHLNGHFDGSSPDLCVKAEAAPCDLSARLPWRPPWARGETGPGSGGCPRARWS